MSRCGLAAAGGGAEDRDDPGGEGRDGGTGVGSAVDEGSDVGGGTAGPWIALTKKKTAATSSRRFSFTSTFSNNLNPDVGDGFTRLCIGDYIAADCDQEEVVA